MKKSAYFIFIIVILLLSIRILSLKAPPNQFDLALSSLFNKNQDGYLVKKVSYRENNFKYSAYVFAPAKKGKHPGVVFCHGNLPTGKDTALYLEICKQLAQKGYVVLDFDIKGFGESEKITKVRLPDDLDFVGDTMAAINYFCKLDIISQDKISIVGHSSGGNIAFAAGAIDPRINNIVSISPGDFNPRRNPRGLKVHYRNRLAKGLEYEIPMDFYDKLITPITMENYVSKIGGKKVLVVIAEHDHINQKRFAHEIYEQMETPSKKLVEIKGAIHTLGARLVDGHKIEDISKIEDFVDVLDNWYKEIYKL